MRTIIVIILLTIGIATHGQTEQWTVVNGKARMESVIIAPDKDAGHLYKQVNRWLAATFSNTEQVVKARIDSELVRGIAYHSDLIRFGALTAADFQYTFALDIKDGKVRFTLINGVVLYDDPQDTNAAYPVELYLKKLTKPKKDRHAEKVIDSINSLSGSLVRSLESYLLMDSAKGDEW